MSTGPASGHRPVALLVAAGVVTIEAAALLGFAGWNLLRRSSEEPSNLGVFEGATAYFGLFGVLVLVVAGALVLQQGWAFGAAVFLQLLALAVTYEMLRGGFWLGAGLLGLAGTGTLLALFAGSTRAALRRS